MKKKKKKSGFARFKTFTRVWAVVYLLSLTIFELELVLMDVLPPGWLVAVFIILGVLSVLLFALLFFKSVKKAPKIFAMVLSCFLVFVFCFGSAYAMGTMSFMSKITNDTVNKNSVAVTEKPFTVYISGKDTYGNINKKSRSDVNMIVVVNPKVHKILMVSIPRDYQVTLSEHGDATDKITHTGIYGIDTTVKAAEDLVGVKMNYYLMVNFSTVVEFIDAIGGITVNSDYDFSANKRNENEVETETFHYVKGKNKLNGDEALAFARERHAFTDGDVQRVKDQQKVFEAVVKKSTNSKTLLSKYPALLNSLGKYMRTNMSEDEIKALIKMQLSEMPNWKMESYTLTGFDSYQSTYTGGSQELYVMEPDEQSVETAKTKIKNLKQEGYKKKGSNNNNSGN